MKRVDDQLKKNIAEYNKIMHRPDTIYKMKKEEKKYSSTTPHTITHQMCRYRYLLLPSLTVVPSPINVKMLITVNGLLLNTFFFVCYFYSKLLMCLFDLVSSHFRSTE